MELFLRRVFFGKTYTIGKLYNGSEYICDTLEPVTRVLKDINGDGDFDDTGEGKIKGKTAIPYGRYRIAMIQSPKFHKQVPVLQGIVGFSAVEIHIGNSVEDTAGCILPGINSSKGRVTNSTDWTKYVTNLIEAAIYKGETVYINIVK